MKIDIALSGCRLFKRIAEDYRVQFGCCFRKEKEGDSSLLFDMSKQNSGVRLMQTQSFVMLTQKRFVFSNVMGITEQFLRNIFNMQELY